MMSQKLHVLIPVGLFGVSTLAAVVIPRWAAKDKMGIDAGIAAVGAFFLCAILALVAALYALVAAIRLRKHLRKGLFLAGTLPLPCLVIALVVLWQMARQPNPQQPIQPPLTKPPTEAVSF